MVYCCIGIVVDDSSALLNLQEILEELGDFGVLDPIKAATRLELLQSPVHKFKSHPTSTKAFLPVKASEIQFVDSNRHDKCSLICDW